MPTINDNLMVILTVSGISISVVGLIVEILALRSIKIRKPYWCRKMVRIISNGSPVIHNFSAIEGLKSIYKESEIENFSVVDIAFWNNGKEVIRSKSDVVGKEIKITASNGKLYHAWIVKETRYSDKKRLKDEVLRLITILKNNIKITIGIAKSGEVIVSPEYSDKFRFSATVSEGKETAHITFENVGRKKGAVIRLLTDCIKEKDIILNIEMEAGEKVRMHKLLTNYEKAWFAGLNMFLFATFSAIYIVTAILFTEQRFNVFIAFFLLSMPLHVSLIKSTGKLPKTLRPYFKDKSTPKVPKENQQASSADENKIHPHANPM